MHTIPSEVVAVLRDAEARLKALIIEATTHDRYDEVLAITSISAKLRALTSLAGASSDGTVADDKDPRSARAQAAAGTNGRAERRGELASEPSRIKYPRFRIDDEQLVKVGWSQANKQEYEHRVSREGVEAFVNYITSLRRNRFPVTSEGVAKALQKDADSPIMGYQVYVVAAWLRSEELLKPQGRQGYSLADGIELREAVKAAWDSLASIHSTR
jgi:hypothetical protein